MDIFLQKEFLQTYGESLSPPWSGSIDAWCHQNLELPPAYAIPGRFSIDSSPYLRKAFELLKDPKIKMLNLIAATQTGKSLVPELFIPYIVINNPAPILRLHQNDEISAVFTDGRLIPMLRNCKPIKQMLGYSRFAATKKAITLPHMTIKVGSAKESLLHGMSICFLFMDEAHLYEFGAIEKALARTTAFAGRRKICISSQPNLAGSELEKYYKTGKVYEWQWKCPHCNQLQPYYWSKQRNDLTYAGVNWDTILLPDNETTDIAKSAATAWLECFHCKHQIPDNITNRRNLNNTSEYVLIHDGGDVETVSLTWPGMVNINLSLSSFVVQYLNAKRIMRNTGLNEDMVTFVNQCLGKFYKSEPLADVSKILIGEYSTDPAIRDAKSIRVLSCDLQRKGLVKYWICREFDKDGNESRLLDFGICRTFEEIDLLAKKWNIPPPLVCLDSGDGEVTSTVYQECIKHGQVLNLPNGLLDYTCWTPMKGSDKLSFIHPDKTTRYYAPPGKGDAMFPVDHKLRGIPAPFVLWSNYSIKTILRNLMDNKVPGVKWLIPKRDSEYEKQLYSEGLVTMVDKKTGGVVTRWMKQSDENHWLDCEAQALAQAIRANCFSATKIDESELKKIVEPETKK